MKLRKISTKATFTANRQQGAVIAEFIVISLFVLISLFLLMPFVGKIVDTRQKVEMGGRYMAWEKTVWHGGHTKSTLDIDSEIHHRIFADQDSQIYTTQKDSIANINYDPMQNYAMRNTEKYESLLIKQGNENRYIELTQNEGQVGAEFFKYPAMIIELGQNLGMGAFNINTKGYYTGTVSTSIKNLSWFDEFKGLDLKISTHSAILTDGWNADGSSDAESKVGGLLSLKIFGFDHLKPFQSIISIFPFATEIGPGWLELGKVTAEPVPPHRLADYK